MKPLPDRPTSNRRRWLLPLAALWFALDMNSAAQAPSPYVTWIERRAGSAFDQATAPRPGLQGQYQINAHILLPLGFASPQVWSSDDVGTALFAVRDISGEAGALLQTCELLAASKPERAYGYRRQGFFREAILMTPEGAAWTAYFGAMTTWAEQTLSEARQSVKGRQPDTVDAIDGLTSPLEAHAAVFKVAPDRPVSDPALLWSALQPKLSARPPRYQHVVTGSRTAPLPSLAFLGAVKASLASAAEHRERPLRPAATRVAFMHNEIVRFLELTSVKRAPGRGRAFAGTNLVRRPEDVFELRYRILTTGGGEAPFTVWAELPAATGAQTPLIIPLAVDLKLKPYLELEFRRTQ